MVVTALAGCQQKEDERIDVADVNARNALARVAALESRVNELEQIERQTVSAPPEPRVPPAPLTPAVREDAYLLTGPATLNGTGTRYPSQQRCEAAKQSLIQQSNERAARLREQGMITVGEPQVGCIPL